MSRARTTRTRTTRKKAAGRSSARKKAAASARRKAVIKKGVVRKRVGRRTGAVASRRAAPRKRVTGRVKSARRRVTRAAIRGASKPTRRAAAKRALTRAKKKVSLRKGLRKAERRQLSKKRSVARSSERKFRRKTRFKLVERNRGASREVGAAAKTARRRPALKLVKGTGGGAGVKKAPGARRATKPRRVKPSTSRPRRRSKLLELPRAAEQSAPKPRTGTQPRPPAAFQQQSEGASEKQLILFRMARGRTSVLAAIQGLLPGSAERPLGEGKWNVREMVLHLCYWDRACTQAVEQAVMGVEADFMSNTKQDDDRMNADALARYGDMSWDEALRLLHATRQELLAAVESIPESPADVWGEGHPLGRMLRFIPPHDLHHADIVKRWRADEGV